MFFKNLTTYRIDLGTLNAEDIESALNSKPLTEPGAMLHQTARRLVTVMIGFLARISRVRCAVSTSWTIPECAGTAAQRTTRN